ncbi:MAG: DUF1836 domain-containing protein [Anaerovoracaceae bacterium]
MNNKRINDFKDMLNRERPEQWDRIPNIDLYMDQVIFYMERQHLGLKFDETLTSSMVNNYAKQGLLPRATGKKYNREHIAHLTAICLLKQVISVTETKALLNSQLEDLDISSFYEKYTNYLDKEMINVDTLIGSNSSIEELSDLALKLAISSYTNKLACECILKSIQKEDED